MLLDYNRIDPLLLPPLDAFPPLDITAENIQDIRTILSAQPAAPKPEGLLEEKVSVSESDSTVDVYVYRGSEAPNQPAVVWIHGGGYVMGSAEGARAMLIATTLNCTVFSVDYRLAPGHPLPAGPEDCYSTLK